jgi:hypothetical protein
VTRRTLALALALACAVPACGSGATRPVRTAPSRVARPAPVAGLTAAPAPREPVVARFGAAQGLLSVEIVNPNAESLVAPTGYVLKAYSANGTLLGTGGKGRVGDRCCTVFALPAGGRHGLYLELGAYASRVARVDVTLVKPRWVKATPSPVAVTHAKLATTSPAVVTATLRADVASDVSVQAFLEDTDGRLVAVISALVPCVGPSARAVPFSLYRAVPEGTRLGSVVAYPAGDGKRCP